MRNSGQEFFTNQKGVVYSVSQDNEVLQRPSYFTNMDEADMRIWLHCVHTSGQRVLIFSPDTDVYHIGLVVAQHIPTKPLSSNSAKVWWIQQVSFTFMLCCRYFKETQICATSLHPSAANTTQSLYVYTGCDYTSFFVGVGKCTFLATFFQYASFIASGSDARFYRPCLFEQ